MTKQQAGRLGGLACVHTHGRAYMSRIGKRGAATTWARYTLRPVDIAGWAMVERATGKIKALIDYAGFLPTANTCYLSPATHDI